ncbi:MAG: quinohemoprotein amine dehydrogenase subunit alpha [Planctomycetes bacterium]|nr:quinohemoprotein amine dehydrogenase subunit alpha [Planctomycetota bacterium]
MRALAPPFRVLAAAALAFAALAALAALAPSVTAQEPARVVPPGHPQGEARQDPAKKDKPDEEEEKKEPRKGIPVTFPLVLTHCSRCHAQDERGHMTRISYERKAPEGWSETVKRMIRLNEVKVTPDEAKQIVRYLSNDHGLTREEAERGHWESERRVHWSEESFDEEFRQTCSVCHPLGRVLIQQRDQEEWQLLRATHVAYFPLSRGQMGGGPPPEESDRRGRGGPAGAGQGSGAAASMQGGGGGGGGGGDAQRRSGGNDRGDRILARLAEQQPLFTPRWEQWVIHRREVPLAGEWTAIAHEVGRGDGVGTVTLTRTAADEYDVAWNLRFADGSALERNGKGLLYAGYSWRGSSKEPGESGRTWREVLLLDEGWKSLKGRLFTGAYDELGVEVELLRRIPSPAVFAIVPRHVTVPSQGRVLDVHGCAFPDPLTATDFHAGAGVTVTAVERVSATLARVTVDVAPDAECGTRVVSFGADPGRAAIELYDAVDYVRVSPVQGLARVGGAKHPPQFERFEAIAVHRGKDGKPYTQDDVDLMTVPARWSLAEFVVRDDDDDVKFVGAIDETTGLFTPAVDGPNPSRKWQANNVGDVFAEATVTIEVPVRRQKDAPGEAPLVPAMASTTFHARGHLLVSVPLYARWNSLEWEDR